MAPWAAGPRARSVLQGHGVWALRGGSLDPRRAALHGAGLGKVRSWFLRCSEGDPPRRAQTPWPWRTDRARGPAAHGAKRHLLNTVETSFEPSLNQPCECGPVAGRGTPRAGPHFMALEGRIGPAGQQPTVPEGDVLNTVETCFEPGPNPALKCGPWCLGPARGVPRPAPGRTSWAGLGKVRSWFLRCSEGDVWHRGLLARGPDPSSRAMVFGPCEGGPSTRAGPHFTGLV